MDELFEVLTDSVDDFALSVKEMYTLAIGVLLALRYSGLVTLRCGQVNGELVSSVCMQLVFCVTAGGLIWWLVGHGIARGDGLLFGTTDYLPGMTTTRFDASWVIELVVVVTSLDGIQSTLIGRVSFTTYIIITSSLLAFSIPVAFHAVWGNTSWLRPGSTNVIISGGFFDPSGAATAALYSGGCAIAATIVVGSRNLRSTLNSGISQHRALDGHNYFYQATGFLYYWLAMFVQVINGSLQEAIDVSLVGNSLMFVLVMTSFGACVALLLTLDLHGHYKLTVVLGAVAATLQASCSVCHCVSVSWSPLIGSVAVICYFVARYLSEKIRIDDPFLVLSSQFVPAVWGSVAAALFADESFTTTASKIDGLFYRNGSLLGSQIVSICVITVWGFVSTVIVLVAVRKATGVQLDVDDATNHGSYYNDISGMFGRHIGEYDDAAESCYAPALTDDATTEATLVDDEYVVIPSEKTFPKPRFRFLKWALFFMVLTGSVGGSVAQADHTGIQNDVGANVSLGAISAQLSDAKKNLDTSWMIICGLMVFSMQLGFCYIESGAVRSSSVINITFKNIGDCAIGSMCWWVCGYGLAYGEGGVFFPSSGDFFLMSPGISSELSDRLPHFFLSFTYMTTAVTIVSGAVAERISLPAYYCIVVFVSSFCYPLVVRSIWSPHGFMSAFSDDAIGSGSLDFAGSVVIHLYGGMFALVAAFITGKRALPDDVDIFSDLGQELAAGHNKFQTASGTLFLWFAWFAFNAGSVLRISDGGSVIAGSAIVSTLLASGASGIFGLVTSRIFFGYFDVIHVCNSVLVGLVSITSGCAYLSPAFAPLVGAIGCLFYTLIRFLRIKLRVDDVIDAGAVHFGGGVWGAIATGMFADCSRVRVATGIDTFSDCGLVQEGGWTLFSVQLVAVLCVGGWACLTALVICYTLKRTIGLRIDLESELIGIDLSEHQSHSYDYIERIQAERERAIEAQMVAEKVTQAMSMFNLDDAAAVIRQARSENDFELYDNFQKLLNNLRQYKPYLPDTLFREVAEISGDGYVSSRSSFGSTESRSLSTTPTAILGNKLGTGLTRYIRTTMIHARLAESHDLHSIAEKVHKYTSLIALFEDSVRESRGNLVKIEGNSLIGVWGISGFVAMSSHVATKTALTVLARYKNQASGIEEKPPAYPLYGLTGGDNCCLYLSIVGGSVVAGNIGTATTRASVMMGPIVHQAEILTKIGPYLQCRLLLGVYVTQSIVNDYDCRPVDVITGDCFGIQHEIYEIVAARSNLIEDNREWMYEIENTEIKTGKHEEYFNAFRSMRVGNYANALTLFSSYLRQNPGDASTLRLMSVARSLQFDSRYKPVSFGRIIASPPFDLYPGESLPHDGDKEILVAALCLVVVTSINHVCGDEFTDALYPCGEENG